MDTVYPASASALARGRRLRRAEPRARHRTMPVTFAEIKEVDEESEASGAAAAAATSEERLERRRRPDVLEERLGKQFVEFRRRRAARARHEALRELSPPPAAQPAPVARAGSDPSVCRTDLYARCSDSTVRQADLFTRPIDASSRHVDSDDASNLSAANVDT